MINPKLSIITINRNNAAGLRKTIESIVSQTYTDFEYIIIDGASTDDSVDVIKEYAEATLPCGEGLGERLYWISEPDKGIYSAMNKGILKAKGEYLLFLNSGDCLYEPNTLNLIFSGFNTTDLLYGNVAYVSNEKITGYSDYPETLSMYHFFYDGLCHQAVFHKRTLFADCLYNENLLIYSDYEFFIKMIIFNSKTTQLVNQLVVKYDVDGISANEEQIEVYRLEKKMVLNQFLPSLVLSDYEELYKFKQLYSTKFQKRINKISSNKIANLYLKYIVKVISYMIGYKI